MKSIKKKPIKQRFKPAAPKFLLMLISGTMWFGVGIFLNTYAYSWLNREFQIFHLFFIGSGIFLAITIHRFGFSKIAQKNIFRISLLPDKPCVFSFMAWKSYFLVLIMIGFGITLRLSPIPKNYLAIVYIGIGLALIFSSLKYFQSALKK